MIHSDNDFATVAFLRIKGAELEPKPTIHQVASIPPLLEERYEAIQNAVAASQNKTTSNPVSLPSVLYSHHISLPLSTSRRKNAWVVVSNVQTDTSNGSDITIEEEVTQCFHTLAGQHS